MPIRLELVRRMGSATLSQLAFIGENDLHIFLRGEKNEHGQMKYAKLKNQKNKLCPLCYRETIVLVSLTILLVAYFSGVLWRILLTNRRLVLIQNRNGGAKTDTI